MGESRVLHDGKIVSLIHAPRPGGGVWEIVRHPGAVAVLALVRDMVVLVGQYRPAVDRFLWEIPAGKREPGEDPGQTARRELMEETGYSGGMWRRVVSFYPSPGYSDEEIILYRAVDPQEGKARPDAGEDLDLRLVSRDEALQLVAAGGIVDGKTLLALTAFWCDCQ